MYTELRKSTRLTELDRFLIVYIICKSNCVTRGGLVPSYVRVSTLVSPGQVGVWIVVIKV